MDGKDKDAEDMDLPAKPSRQGLLGRVDVDSPLNLTGGLSFLRTVTGFTRLTHGSRRMLVSRKSRRG